MKIIVDLNYFVIITGFQQISLSTTELFLYIKQWRLDNNIVL